MAKALEVKNLYKNYGDIQAVKDVSFEIAENEIFGLVGPNGAGKSTVLRVVATILTPTSGQIYVYGQSLIENPQKIREIISYLPEEAGAYKNLKGLEYLKFMAAIYTDDSQKQKQYVEFASEISGLKDRLKSKVDTYSKGMTRKLLLARTVMSRPKLAILDEPTSGLDVINSYEIRNIVKDLSQHGMAVLLSSHNMLEVEFLSHRVGIIDQGKIHDIGEPEQLKQEYKSKNLEEVFIALTKKI